MSIFLGVIFAALSFITSSSDYFDIFMPLTMIFLGLNLFLMSHEYSKNNNKALSYTTSSVGIFICVILFFIVFLS